MDRVANPQSSSAGIKPGDCGCRATVAGVAIKWTPAPAYPHPHLKFRTIPPSARRPRPPPHPLGNWEDLKTARVGRTLLGNNNNNLYRLFWSAF